MAADARSSAPPDDPGFALDWAAFSNDAIFDHVDSITDFALVLQFPRFLAWSDPSQMASYQDILYESVYDALAQSEFYRFEELRRTRSSDGVGVNYRDADFGFELTFSQDSELTLVRQGSSLELFYGWYSRVMAQMSRVVAALQQQLEQDARRGDVPKNIDPVRGIYRFRFILYDFKEFGKRGGSVKNSRVLRAALTHIPGNTGALVELTDKELPDLGRIDLTVSRVHDSPSGPIREVYDVEAPGNRDYGTLWFTCSYIAEAPIDSTRYRGHPDFTAFLERYDYPLMEFVRERALVNFLSSVTQGLAFKATPGRIP